MLVIEASAMAAIVGVCAKDWRSKQQDRTTTKSFVKSEEGRERIVEIGRMGK
jgi:hypothetical protein